jgi:hypothetical protein
MYGGVYSFLPLGESRSGAKFPIQADFLVQPGRDSINAEARWNHWLLEEVAALCKEAIQHFQKHETWKHQYLAAFEFKHSPGFEAYDKLFRPKLIDAIEKLIEESPSVPTAGDKWAKPSDVVLIDETPEAIQALSGLGILAADEIAPAFGGAPNLVPVHPDTAKAQPNRFRKVNRWSLFANKDFLESKAQAPDGSAWFRSLYVWLQKHPVSEQYLQKSGRRWITVKRTKSYHSQEIVLRSDKTLSPGGPIFILDLGESDPFLAKLAYELQATKPTLHPDIIAGAADDQERDVIKGFLTGLTGVQKMDAKTVCLEAILPKITTAAQTPEVDELLTLSKYCQKHFPLDALMGKELWIVNKRKQVRKASDVLFPVEFKPDSDWETHQRYVPGADFLSAEYVTGSADTQALRAWRDFLHAGGVKYEPDNGVEVFAMKFAEEKLASRFKNMVFVEKLNHGYDIEAEDTTGQKVHFEVKGLSGEGDVELTGNEAKAARIYGQTFYLGVVSGIPDTPALHLVRDPNQVGEKEKLTIRAADWKRERFDDTQIQEPPIQ